eukprot:Nitzschia sp. Nitz4//scaffold5_size260463//137594//138600//NITZ4_000987-RA/size260463-augustus-gene-0.99-mRNA-1//-1//CDS//3329555355//5790//frame0
MGTSSSRPLAMIAVAKQLQLQRFQIVVLKDSLEAFADSSGFVNREAFDIALVRAKITESFAVEIFDLLFTMWDHHATQMIPARPFASGIAPLACFGDDIASVLKFCLMISDSSKSHKIGSKELHDLLIHIDNTATYFGDAQLEPGDIDNVVEAVFDGSRHRISHELCIRKLMANAYIKRFVSGKTRTRVQFKSELEVVTEFFDPEVPSELSARGWTSPLVEFEVPTLRLSRDEESTDDKSSLTDSFASPAHFRRNGSLLDSWDEDVESVEEEEEVETKRHVDPPSSVSRQRKSFWEGVRGLDPPSFMRAM